jgi:hypothetical protein
VIGLGSTLRTGEPAMGFIMVPGAAIPVHPKDPVHPRPRRASDGMGRRFHDGHAPTHPGACPAETGINGIIGMKGIFSFP